jgi:hypothetical protein
MAALDTSYSQAGTGIYFHQSNTELHFPSGTSLVLDAGASFANATSQGTGRINFDLFSARLIASNNIPNTAATPSGGLLTSNTAPSIARTNGATDKSIVVSWVATSVIELQLPTVYLPVDMDVTQACTLNILAAMATTTGPDTPTVAFGLWDGIGGSNVGGNTGAVTGTTAAVYSFSVAANTLTANSVISCQLTPGTHANDAVNLYAAWISFTKKSS